MKYPAHVVFRLPPGLSRPARALWIEIAFFTWMRKEKLVEAREGLVD